MALTRITKGVIKPNENYDTHNINSTGIITATGGNITGNLSVGGVLTYEDVTSIDSVGIITAQKGIHIGAGVSAVGVGTFGGLDIGGDIDVDGHTNLDNVSIAGVSTFSDNVHLLDNDYLYIGGSAGTTDGIRIYHNGNNSFVRNTNKTLYIGQESSSAGFPLYLQAGNEFYLKHFASNGGQATVIKSIRSGAFTLYHGAGNVPASGTERLVTTSTGLSFPRDIDVDGHTELDNVNISGVVTATTFIGDGSNLTGVSGFATALSNDQSSSLNVFFKTPKQVNVSTGESIVVQSDATSGNIAFCRESIIHVSTGATMRVATGTQLHTNVLDLF